MHHSITFGEENDTRNTWSDWGLIPESPPLVESPQPKTNFIDIPGRIRGPYDASLIPFGRQSYDRISGSWTFVMLDDYWHTPNPRRVHERMRSWLHGRRTKIVLEDEPDFYYTGLITVTPPELSAGPFVVEINYDLEPLRYNADGTIDITWIPDLAGYVPPGEGGDPMNGYRFIPSAGIATIEDMREIIDEYDGEGDGN